MTHKEAIKRTLEMLGGKAYLKQIYPVAIKLIGNNTRSADIRATIRRELNSSPLVFKASLDEKGCWELISYQEEIAAKDDRIKELEDENERLRAVKTEDDFVRRLVQETKNLYKHEKEKIEVIRQILYKVGRIEEEAELDACIEGKNKPTTQNNQLTLVLKKETNIDKNYGPNIEHNGGTLGLPEGRVATSLPKSDDGK